MATEYEELKLVVTLDDNASRELERLKAAVSNLGTGVAGAGLKDLNKKVEDLGVRIKSLSSLAESIGVRIGASLGPVGVGITAIGTATVGLALAFQRLGSYLNEFSRATIALDVLSKQIGVLPGQLKVLQDQMTAIMSPEAAQRTLLSFGQTLQQLGRVNSQAWKEFVYGAGRSGGEAQAFINNLTGLADQGKFHEALNYAIDVVRANFNRRATQVGVLQATRERNTILERLGLTPEVMEASNKFRAAGEEELKRWYERQKLAREFSTEWNRMSVASEEFTVSLKTTLLPILRDLTKWLNEDGAKWGKFIAEQISLTVRDLVGLYRDVRRIYNYITGRARKTLEQGGAVQPGAETIDVMPGAADPFKGIQESFDKYIKEHGGKTEENTDQLKIMNQNLYQLLNLQTPEGMGGGGGSFGGGGGDGFGANLGYPSINATSPSATTPSTTGPRGTTSTTPPASAPAGSGSGGLLGGGPPSGALPVSAPPLMGGGERGTSIKTVPIRPDGSTNRYNQPGAPTGPQSLSQLRFDTFGDELKNSALRDRFYASIYAEAGGQGPRAQQAFMESVLNRAASRGQTLAQALSSTAYFPQRTQSIAGRGPTEGQRNAYAPILESVMAGSNLSSLATGNWEQATAPPRAGPFGRGGYETFRTRGELFGREARDVGWAERTTAALSAVDVKSVRSELDTTQAAEITSRVQGSATAFVKVGGGQSVQTAYDSARMFKPVEVVRQTQMEPALEGPRTAPGVADAR